MVFRFQFQSTLQQGPLPHVSSSEGRSQRQQILQLIMLKISDDFVLNVDQLFLCSLSQNVNRYTTFRDFNITTIYI